ncbi:lanthionine synthetase C family protein [Acrocarpospora catenulata]|uniref:lanthionine synthetase C family protein n=1 Tax=Acrocarpospora catenulata TaxID=2836182 RepID=UPI001BD9CFE7|nr:lanthionine synthetase C family protein [Acrocarpospora catenulata]
MTAIMCPADVRDVADHLAAVLATPPEPDPEAGYGPDSSRWDGQSLAHGAAGIVILHGVRALDQIAGWEPVKAWLAVALREDVASGGGVGLWHGAPAIAFALLTGVPADQSRDLLERLDTAVLAITERRLEEARRRMDACLRPQPDEFDLIRGLSGIGAYLLRRDPDSIHLREILSYLVRLTQPMPARDQAGVDAPGWWTSRLPEARPAESFADGHSDQGMAHGICGPLALLALAAHTGVTIDGHIDAMKTVCAWLTRWRQDGTAGWWWPERVTLGELRRGRPHHDGPARPSWCYGTPGIARALQLAALALDDPSQAQAAEQALIDCIADTAQLAHLDTAGLCHGWAGLLATARAAAGDAASPAVRQSLPTVVDALLQHLARAPAQPTGLIDGTAGAALVLHSIATPHSRRGWETSLLIA